VARPGQSQIDRKLALATAMNKPEASCQMGQPCSDPTACPDPVGCDHMRNIKPGFFTCHANITCGPCIRLGECQEGKSALGRELQQIANSAPLKSTTRRVRWKQEGRGKNVRLTWEHGTQIK
jgi:hypothetical protein